MAVSGADAREAHVEGLDRFPRDGPRQGATIPKQQQDDSPRRRNSVGELVAQPIGVVSARKNTSRGELGFRFQDGHENL